MNGAADGPDLNTEIVAGERDENSSVSVGARGEPLEQQASVEPASGEGSGMEGKAKEEMEALFGKDAPFGGRSEETDDSVLVAEPTTVVPDGGGNAGNQVVVKTSVEVGQVVRKGPGEEVVSLEGGADVKMSGGDEETNAPLLVGEPIVPVQDSLGDVVDPLVEKVVEVFREVASEAVVVLEKRVEVKTDTISMAFDVNNVGCSIVSLNPENGNSVDDRRDDVSIDDSNQQNVSDGDTNVQSGLSLAAGQESPNVEVEGTELDQIAEDNLNGADFASGSSTDLPWIQTAADIVVLTCSKKIEVVNSEAIPVCDDSEEVDGKASAISEAADADHVAPDEGESADESRKESDDSAVAHSHETCINLAEQLMGALLPEGSDGRFEQTTAGSETEENADQDEGSGGKDEDEDKNAGKQNLSLEKSVDHCKNVAETSLPAQLPSMDGLYSGTDGNSTDNITLKEDKLSDSVSDGVQTAGGCDAEVDDSLPIEAQDNDNIQTNKTEDMVNQTFTKEDFLLGEHVVSRNGDNIGESNGDQEIELVESHSGAKTEHHLADEGKADDINGQKVPESPNMENDEDVEDDEVHKISYFEEVFPEDILSEEDNFCVGDIIWGKVRSHPWWPGQIFDASDSSEKALKYCKKDTFLIAYFGDRTFAWCDKAQLKPFWTNFARLQKQSSSSAFLNAIDCVLEEVARRTALGLTCSCFPEQAYDKLKSPEVENAGVCEGVTIADNIGKSLSVASFKPDQFLSYVKGLAVFDPEESINKLEFAFVQAQLSAFYSAKGYLQLPAFHIYGGFSGDETGLSPAKNSHAGSSVGLVTLSPRGEEPMTPASLAESGEGKSRAGSSRKRKRVLEESPYRSRKQRSLAELMDGKATPLENDVKGQQKKDEKSKSVSPPSGKKRQKSESVSLSSGKKNLKSESASPSSGNKKQKSESISLSSGKKEEPSESVTPSSGKKRQKFKSISPSNEKKKKSVSDSVESSQKRRRSFVSPRDTKTEGEDGPDTASSGKGKKSNTDSQSIGKKKKAGDSDPKETSQKKRRRFGSPKDIKTIGEETPDASSDGVSKSGKKTNSRVLSSSGKRHKKDDTSVTPDDSTLKKRSSNVSGDSNAETPMVQKSFKIGDRITKVASQLTGPSPIIKCNNDASHKDITDVKMAKGSNVGNGSATPPTPEASAPKKKHIPKVVSASDEMLLLLGSAAENPLQRIDSPSKIIDFFTNFRNSNYEKGSTNKRYKKSLEKLDGRPGRKTSDSESEGKPSNSLSGGKKALNSKSGKGKSSSSKPGFSKTYKFDGKKNLNLADTVDYSSPEEGASKTRRKRKVKSPVESPAKKQICTPQQLASPPIGLKLDSEREQAAGGVNPELSNDLGEGTRTGNLDEKSGEECSPTALILTFTEGDALPSESDLSRIFSRYGPLEESETEVLRKTSRARVVFKKRPDAEVAFSSAGKFSIFGPSLVSYRLRYLSSTSKDSPRSTMRGIKEAASADGSIKSPFPGNDELRVAGQMQN